MSVVIISAVRTAIGKFGGSLMDFGPGQLGTLVLRETLKRAEMQPLDVDEVIMGNVLSAGHGQNVARQAAIDADIPIEVPSYAVNMVCGSGLKSVILGAQSIMTGDTEVVLTGGVECMSQAPYLIRKARWGAKMGNDELVDSMIYDGLWDVFGDYHMGITAENVAKKYNITREEQDEFSARSQNKTETAIKEGKFKEEIVPIDIPLPKGNLVTFAQDEFPRFGTTKEILAKLKPAFKNDGTVTAGNSSGINDGAASILLMDEGRADNDGIEPLATIEGYASYGVDPGLMGMGPVEATRLAIERANLHIDEIELVELNEAFASQSIAVIRELGLDADIVNVNGGAIALGHPIGASGTRTLVTLLHEMKRRDCEYGLTALCIGGGQGISMIVRKY
jgi:acetyl-CoA C-acetyltransferase